MVGGNQSGRLTTNINLLIHLQCDKMMFDEESKRRTSEYIFGAEMKKPTPAKKSKVTKNVMLKELLYNVSVEADYYMDALGTMVDKLHQMDEDRKNNRSEDTVEDEAMWNDFVEYYESIAKKLDDYIADMDIYMGSLKSMSEQMHQNYREMKDL